MLTFVETREPGSSSPEETSHSLNCASDEPCLKQDGRPGQWMVSHQSHKTLCQLLARQPVGVNGGAVLPSTNTVDKFFLEVNNNITYDVEGVPYPGDDIAQDKRMNANSHGHNRNSSRSTNGSVVTSGDGLTWTSDVSASPGQSVGRTRQPMQGMLSGRPSSQVQESTRTPTMLASAGSPNLSGIFRTPATLTDSSPRHLSTGSQFSTLYTSTGGGSSPLSPYSNLHGAHPATVVAAQGSHMQSPYSAFYNQFPASHGYSQRAMLGHYPHIESYSAVLQSMGSQVQHASQTQLPRNSYLSGQIPQYSVVGGSQRSLSVSTSPSPQGAPRHSPAASGQHPGESAARDMKSPLKYERDMEGHEYVSPHYKEDRTHSLSSIELGSGGKSVSFKDLPTRHDTGKDPSDYKVPSGKEGSRKHRILTRPSDSVIESSSVDIQSGSYSISRSEQPSPKRSKSGYGSSHPVTHTLPRPRADGADQGVTDSGAGAHRSSNLHYPPHFMKGSIIQLANGELKRVEDLQTDDFVQSADISSDLKIDSSTVVRMELKSDQSTVILGFVVGEHRVQVTVEATVEHPFFVFGQGWSSCDPDKTLRHYGLECHRLAVGDICISLTHKEVTARAAELSQQQRQQQEENRQLQQGRSPTLTFQVPRSIDKCSQGEGQMYFNVSSSDNSEKIPRNSQQETAGDVNQDQHQLDSRPPRKRHWSSSDHNNDGVQNDQNKQEKS